MQFVRSDLNHVDNLVKTLKRAKLEVEGLEVLALADMIKWVAKLASDIKSELEQAENEPVPVEAPKTQAPTPPAYISKKSTRRKA
jgi:hypothetical protein